MSPFGTICCPLIKSECFLHCFFKYLVFKMTDNRGPADWFDSTEEEFGLRLNFCGSPNLFLLPTFSATPGLCLSQPYKHSAGMNLRWATSSEDEWIHQMTFSSTSRHNHTVWWLLIVLFIYCIYHPFFDLHHNHYLFLSLVLIAPPHFIHVDSFFILIDGWWLFVLVRFSSLKMFFPFSFFFSRKQQPRKRNLPPGFMKVFESWTYTVLSHIHNMSSYCKQTWINSAQFSSLCDNK